MVRRDPLIPALVVTALLALAPAAVVEHFGGRAVALSGLTHLGLRRHQRRRGARRRARPRDRRRAAQDSRAVLVGTAFSVMAGLLFIHGLSSPDFLIGMNGVVALRGAATLPVGARARARAAPGCAVHSGVGRLLVLAVVPVVGVVALGLVGMCSRRSSRACRRREAPRPRSAVGSRSSSRRSRAPRAPHLPPRAPGRDLVVVVGLGWLAASLVGALMLRYYELGWWLGHGLEVAGILLVGAPVAADLRRARSVAPARAATCAPPSSSQRRRRFLGAQVRALTRALAEKDTYTESTRGASRCWRCRSARSSGLAGAAARRWRSAGCSTTSASSASRTTILKKPGPLDEDEFGEIKRHPAAATQLLGQLGGFGDGVRRLVLDHHERLDGKGYPRGLDAPTRSTSTRASSPSATSTTR